MITFKQFLQEMPLASITKHDRHNEKGGGSFEPADRKVIQKFMNDGTYKKKLEKIPFPLYVYIADDFDLERHGYEYPEGEITYDHRALGTYFSRSSDIDLNRNILKVILLAVDNNLTKDPDSVHLIIGDNYSAEGQIALTPWMIAHRLSHAIFQSEGDETFRADIFRKAKKSTNQLTDLVSVRSNKAPKYVYTFKSAQMDNLQSGELQTELCTQFLVTGKITLNYDAFLSKNVQLVKQQVQDTEDALSAGFKALAGKVFYI